MTAPAFTDTPVDLSKSTPRFEKGHMVIWEEMHKSMLGFANLVEGQAYDGIEKISPEFFQLLRTYQPTAGVAEASKHRLHHTKAVVINLTAINPEIFSYEKPLIMDNKSDPVQEKYNENAKDQAFELASEFLMASGELCALLIENDQMFLAYLGIDRKPASLEKRQTNSQKESFFEAFFEEKGLISEGDIANGGGLQSSKDWHDLVDARLKINAKNHLSQNYN